MVIIRYTQIVLKLLNILDNTCTKKVFNFVYDKLVDKKV